MSTTMAMALLAAPDSSNWFKTASLLNVRSCQQWGTTRGEIVQSEHLNLEVGQDRGGYCSGSQGKGVAQRHMRRSKLTGHTKGNT